MLHLQGYTFTAHLHNLNSKIFFNWGLELSFQSLQLKYKFLIVLRSRCTITAARTWLWFYHCLRKIVLIF